MTGACWAIPAYNQEKEAKVFKGTLLGIVVSFLILVSFAYLLNLAENYWYVNNKPQHEANRVQDKAISENNNKNPEFIGAAPAKSEDSLSRFINKLFGIKTAHAASSYQATLLLRSASELTLAPGEEATYRVGFKNTGSAPWYNTGARFISIYTHGPKYRQSEFKGSDWYRSIQPAVLREAKVLPGTLGFLEFKLKAPQKEGKYTETFYLAAEDTAWIEGGRFSIPITVAGTQKSQTTNTQSQTNTASSEQLIPTAKHSNFQANLLLTSHKKIEAQAGEIVNVRLGYKNTGKTTWDMEGLVVPSADLLSNGRSIFYHPTWTSGHQPAVVGTSRVAPGHLAFIDFKIKIPNKAGEYTAKFNLVANYDKQVNGGSVEIPITVSGSVQSAVVSASNAVVNRISMSQPEILIGLSYITNSNESIELTANKNFVLRDGAGASLGNFSANEPVTINYNFSTKIFKIINARLNFSVSGELHFSGLDNDTVFTVLSMSRPTSYGWNDNKYRDGIILRESHIGRLWVINKLPLEHYLWGIAETSNLSDLDYIKSIIVASRTYALYHYGQNSKYSGYFHMRATTADQLYRGYNSELRRPRVKQAAQETAGQAITYNGKIVVTPYFGHSDGRTRSWSEVWGGAGHPWLKSVSVPSDSGRTLWGHGVGMSAKGAYHNAETDGWNHLQILRYYYTGVEVSRIY